MEEVFEIKQLANKGFGIVASKELQPGQLVLVEQAGVLGPASPESCLECLELTKESCNLCGFSLCHDCQSHPQEFLSRHDSEECVLLQKTKNPSQQEIWNISGLFNIVFPLRLLRLKTSDPKLYKQITSLEGHVEHRQHQKSSASSDSMIAMGNMLSKIFDVTVNEAIQAIAIQLTNGFEVNLPSMSGRAVYPIISYFNHACVPNVTQSHKVVMPNEKNCFGTSKEDTAKRFFLELKVQRTVLAGTELTIRYNSVFEGFVKRQKTFTQEWFFECGCPRCSDPTEFGTFTSAVKCFQCSKGFVIPYPTLLNSHLKDADDVARFHCTNCGQSSSFNFVESVEQDVSNHMNQDSPNMEQMVDLIKACTATLHSQHYLVMMLKDHFVFKKTDSVELLEIQDQYAKDVIQYLQVLDPGRTWRKSQILSKLRAITTALAKKKSDGKDGLDVAALKRTLVTIQDLTVALDKLK